VAGVAAGLGVAVPFGAIAILIVETAIRRGRSLGWAAGAGAATADFTYASLAALFGAALAALVGPIQVPLRILSVVVLVVIGGRGIVGALARARRPAEAPKLERLDESSVPRTYALFVGLTIVNPATLVYFVALILGLPAVGSGVGEKVSFVFGAGLASLAWQLLIATTGSALHQRLPPRAIEALSLAGYGIVLLIAANVAQTIVTA